MMSKSNELETSFENSALKLKGRVIKLLDGVKCFVDDFAWDPDFYRDIVPEGCCPIFPSHHLGLLESWFWMELPSNYPRTKTAEEDRLKKFVKWVMALSTTKIEVMQK